jgi:hypothetical protein
MTPATPKLYEGTKRLTAQPMTRGEYNGYRGWQVPEGEDPADAGYLVEYQDGGKANDSRHAGYISWSPADVFERTYKPVSAETSDSAVEREIQAKGLTAPRVTPADIEASIAAEYSFTVDKATTGCPQLPGLTLISIVVLILNNGHRIVGVNEGPVSGDNFDAIIGRQLARKKATDQIWPLLGYELRERLYQRSQPASAPDPA